MHSQSQINKFTYRLEMRNKTEWSEAWSESYQQVHLHAGSEKARQNGHMHGQSHINKFTYRLGVRKQDRMVTCMVRVKSTSSHTDWE